MIKDSGNRRKFETGAVRDIQEGKGRCDLLPLDVVGQLMGDNTFRSLDAFQQTGNVAHLYDALDHFIMVDWFPNDPAPRSSAMLEVAVHFEEGCAKYGERNWQKGIPVHCYIDSAVRHYLKFLRGDDDERHDRAFVWNLICCIWTVTHVKEVEK